MSFRHRVILSVTIGILAGLATYWLPVSTIYQGAHIGDLCPPLYSIMQFRSGAPVYGGQYFNDILVTAYPFTMMLAIYPFSFLPLALVGPLFSALTSSLFAFALLREGKLWRMFVLISPSYIFALYSLQVAPLLAAALLLPCLLPLACIKPQLGLVLCAAGNWTSKTLTATVGFLLFSLALYPRWPVDWLRAMNIHLFAGTIPIFCGPGFLLLLSLCRWRDPRFRILAAMSITPQRLWYDQLFLYLIPETRAQLLAVLVCSWSSLLLTIAGGWFLLDGLQHPTAWLIVVNGIYLPVLILLYRQNILLLLSNLKQRITPKITE